MGPNLHSLLIEDEGGVRVCIAGHEVHHKASFICTRRRFAESDLRWASVRCSLVLCLSLQVPLGHPASHTVPISNREHPVGET